MATIKVTAGEGRTVPVPSSIATSPGAGLLLLTPGVEIDVEESDTHVQRCLRSGDFVKVTTPARTKAPTKES